MRVGRGLWPGTLGLATAVVAGVSAASGAGLVAPKDAGALAQPSVEVVVVHATDVGNELFVLQTSYELKSGKPVDSLAWAIPVPASPRADECATADPALFGALQGLGAKDAKAHQSPASVGTLEAKLLDGKGILGVKALQGWLDTNGFAAVREKDCRFYSGAGCGYVAVKATAKEGKLPAKGLLAPYALRLATNRPFVPLKLLATAGPLDLRVTLLTTQAIDPVRAEKSGLKPNPDRATTVDAAAFPKPLADLLATKLGSDIHDALKKGKVQLLVLEGKLNGADKASQIESWFEDPPLPWKK